MEREFNIAGLVLAAGFSGRMNAFKPLINYNGKSFLLNVIEKLSLVCNPIVVVTGFKSGLIDKEIEQNKELLKKVEIRTVFNPDYSKGMFTSLQKGLDTIDDSEWVLYHFIDQPNLPKEFYSEFVSSIDNHANWIQPVYKGTKGHPILFDKTVREKIINATANFSLRDISHIKEIKKKYFDCNYKEILTDIDTPEEYDALVSEY